MATTVAGVTAGQDVLETWGDSVATAIGELQAPRLPWAQAHAAGVASSSNTTLGVVAAGLGGAIIQPIILQWPMAIQSVTIAQGSSASLRTCEGALYRDSGSTTLARITGTTFTLSFTPGAADDRTANVDTPGTVLDSGVVYVVVRNTSAAQDFLVRRLIPAETAGNRSMSNLVTKIAALGATLVATSGAGWSGGAGTHYIRLNGRIMGQSAAF